jgi:hypothetical protein
MTRHMAIPFQIDRPVFCKWDGLSFRGKTYKVGQILKWQEMQLPQDRIQIMYNQGMLYHDAELEAQQEERIIGDGLDLLDIESLHALVKKINDKVKLVAKSEDDFAKKKCAMSKIKDKQVGLIRRWRTVYGHLE